MMSSQQLLHQRHRVLTPGLPPLQVFAIHAGVVSRFVLGPLMRSVPAKGSQASDPKAGQVWGHVSRHIKLRTQALKVPYLCLGVPPFLPFCNDLAAAALMAAAILFYVCYEPLLSFWNYTG